ncbi:MAG: DUF2752 domain-containing protein, partial [Verrucomicrobia bacterium]|nr:DUF2752 domain-containing protein [Verrucomicrobiota bacterium]
ALFGGCANGILALLPMQLFSCPWKSCTGLPCPGFGMTRNVRRYKPVVEGKYPEPGDSAVFSWSPSESRSEDKSAGVGYGLLSTSPACCNAFHPP